MTKIFLLSFILLFTSCQQDNSSKSSQNNQTSNFFINDIHHSYSNYKEAFQKAKQENKPVFILFTTQYCRWCIKLKETTFRDKRIVQRLNEEFIVLLLDKNHSNFPSKYKIKAIPALYITDKNEEIFTTIFGYHKDPMDYLKWFNYIKKELSN